jgi:DNA-directed RNA polymerase subunit M/transcription elongation factor TFIIS
MNAEQEMATADGLGADPGLDAIRGALVEAGMAEGVARRLSDATAREVYEAEGDEAEGAPTPPTNCPSCGSESICAQTREDQEPWACLDCAHEWE